METFRKVAAKMTGLKYFFRTLLPALLSERHRTDQKARYLKMLRESSGARPAPQKVSGRVRSGTRPRFKLDRAECKYDNKDKQFLKFSAM
jgi:hypothetical protein